MPELAGRTGGAYPTVTREVRRLEQSGLVEVDEVGRSKRVRSTVRGRCGIAASEGLFQTIGGAVPNDIDVLVPGGPDRDDVYAAARRAERRIGLPVNTTIRRADDWERADDSFARQVKSSPMVVVAG